MSKSTNVGGVAQQPARGFGVAVGAALLAVIAGPARVTVDDIQLALFLVALIPLCSALGFPRLLPVVPRSPAAAGPSPARREAG